MCAQRPRWGNRPSPLAPVTWLAWALVVPSLALALAAAAAEVGPQSSPLDGLPTPTAHVVALVEQDLATYLSVSRDDIEIVDVVETTWPDTCLGLPAPELCAPGPTPGYRVVLRALGQLYPYHTDRDALFRYAGPGDVPTRPDPDPPH